jgi:very-short-patch-repair endonuclease
MPSDLRNFAKRLRREATKPEEFLWNALRDRRFGGYKFRRQMPIDRFVVDFCCVEAGLIVELDGVHHEALRAFDAERTAILRRYGFEVFRFANSEIMDHPEPALARLKAKLDEMMSAGTTAEAGRRPSPAR